jgi:ubiquinone/menaquinone biosynthesis C-methylase UbiE
VFISQTAGPFWAKCHLVAPDLPGHAKPARKVRSRRTTIHVPFAEKSFLEDNRMGFYDGWLFPRVLDLVMQQKKMVPFRERIGKAASGRVLDIGIGSGLNLPFYGEQAAHVCGVDPSAELLQFAQERAQKTQVPVELLRGSGEALPLDDKSFDTVVMTFTLCTVNDAARTLAEIRRVLKPEGVLLFAEHGRAPEIGVARWQDRLTPIWKRVAGGCHLNRKPDDLMQAAGFRIESLETGYLKSAPRTMGFVFSGSARPS